MWSIGLIENTLQVPETAIDDLWEWNEKTCSEVWSYKTSILDEGKLTFNSDHMEHQDFLCNKKVQDILNKHKVKGRVLWGSLEGDNANTFWGYEFDGKGNMNELIGFLEWQKVVKDKVVFY